MRSKDAHGMANTVNPDEEQSDLDLQCLPRSVCPIDGSWNIRWATTTCTTEPKEGSNIEFWLH